jgi:hypothetical protein
MSAEFREAAIAAVLKRGYLVRQDSEGWYWGWQEWDHDHAQLQRDGGCQWVTSGGASTLKEYAFDEFDHTDADDSLHSTILAVTHVYCTCGLYKNREVAVQGSTGDLLGMLLDVGEIKKEYK